uniref:AlNc14C198G8614 protein n=1 Tax=Albugo laibachii Nc14 TaxID=890382 RepID=F0WQE4_9STRA|nr:AlNc14C198G8614 [Albugo laibachii Nc14]|eukprot:CCA23552.1 AlNc14C198G8614 [Albugo laibachii Nc14]
MSAAKRIRLNSEQKRVLREHHAAHPDMTCQELSEWAAFTFKLTCPLARTSLTELVKRQEVDTERNPLRKASHCAHSPELEAHLVVWINSCEEMKISIVTGASIRQKAEMIRSILFAATPTIAAVLSKLMLSKGWLDFNSGRVSNLGERMAKLARSRLLQLRMKAVCYKQLQACTTRRTSTIWTRLRTSIARFPAKPSQEPHPRPQEDKEVAHRCSDEQCRWLSQDHAPLRRYGSATAMLRRQERGRARYSICKRCKGMDEY